MATISWNKIGYSALALGALALVGVGAWMAWPPAGLMGPGLLIWLDLSLVGRKRGQGG